MHYRVRRAAAMAAVALMWVVAACGSQLSPETVRDAFGVSGQGPAAGQGSVGGPGDPAAAAPGEDGAVAGPDPVAEDGEPGAIAGKDAAPAAGGQPGRKGGTAAASCTGFTNQTGITDDKIVIANASDISGPVPGLFEASRDATKAYVAYFNATSDLCGRKLELLALDSRTDAGADQQAYAKACESAFAAVGSMAAFDSGGAGTAEKCGLPDLRSASVTAERSACRTCFGAQSSNVDEFQNAVPDYFLKNYREASQNAAYLWINAGAGPSNAANQSAAMTKRGMKFVYKAAIDVSEFNYGPYVQQMKDKGVRWVQFLGAYQQAVKLAQAMRQQSFKPDAFVLDPTAYDQRYVESGGPAVEGTTIFLNFTPFEEAAANAELRLYRQWLQQVRPGAQPTFFGLFSWSATRLFVEQAAALGGRLTRGALLDRLARVDNWSANGLHAPQHVGSRHVADCWRFIKLKGGRWVPEGGSKYRCSGVTKVG